MYNLKNNKYICTHCPAKNENFWHCLCVSCWSYYIYLPFLQEMTIFEILSLSLYAFRKLITKVLWSWRVCLPSILLHVAKFSFLVLQLLEKCFAHSICSENNCWIGKLFSKVFLPIFTSTSVMLEFPLLHIFYI